MITRALCVGCLLLSVTFACAPVSAGPNTTSDTERTHADDVLWELAQGVLGASKTKSTQTELQPLQPKRGADVAKNEEAPDEIVQVIAKREPPQPKNATDAARDEEAPDEIVHVIAER